MGGSENDVLESASEPDSDVHVDSWSPLNWPLGRKWVITAFSSFMCFAVGINALSVASAAQETNKRFGISDENFPHSYWIVTAWNAGAALAPIVVLPIMEEFGLRTAYLVSYTLFVLFVIPQALAPSYAVLLPFRFLAGGCGSIVQNSVANVIGDIWSLDQSGIVMTLFTYAYLGGYTLGPIIGAAIITRLYWRWIFYVQLIFYGVLLPVSWFLVPETRRAVILKRRQQRQAKDMAQMTIGPSNPAGPHYARAALTGAIRPLRLLFTEPALFFVTFWCGLAIGNIFIASQSIAITYPTNHAFTENQSSFVQVSMIVGETIGVPLCIIQNRIWRASATRNSEIPGQPVPESRLEMSIITSFIGITGGLFIYAWTSYPFVSWVAPAIGLALVGVGISVVVQAAVIYATDAYGSYAGSAVAAIAFMENLISAFAPLAAQAMYRQLGFQWASSTIAFFALALSFAPVVLYWKGRTIRARSKFMCSDEVIKR